MRVYLPMLVGELTEVRDAADLPARQAHGVTSALRAADPAADEEDLEFEAMCQALDSARALGPGARVVAAADTGPREDAGDGALLAGQERLRLDEVVSFHVEEGSGDVGTGYDDLLWYDVTELDGLVSAVSP
ncbi:DUF6912 family protein [Janibacter cremeus]|uniref:Uncharacterized protein n=1 Tax=Janibacter cremeus TaxID=1285192 RepID=A0A852VZK0_9MICO|nr:hypothetical protein [Janibacter cremeus]NYF99145.1 hypothetical protein [Janibacter cremeus]